MSEKFKSIHDEFSIYEQAIGLDKIEKDSAQYIETRRAFLSGMLCAIGKLTVETKQMDTDNLPDALNELVDEITNELYEN